MSLNGGMLARHRADDAHSVGCEAGRCCERLAANHPSQAVDRTPHPEPAAVQHVRVHHRRRNVGVPEQFLDCPDVVAGLQKMRRERVPEGVAGHPLRQPRPPAGIGHGPLNRRFVEVIARWGAESSIPTDAGRRKDELPAPFGLGRRELARVDCRGRRPQAQGARPLDTRPMNARLRIGADEGNGFERASTLFSASPEPVEGRRLRKAEARQLEGVPDRAREPATRGSTPPPRGGDRDGR
jgi:hypothetical protein